MLPSTFPYRPSGHNDGQPILNDVALVILPHDRSDTIDEKVSKLIDDKLNHFLNEWNSKMKANGIGEK